MKFSLKDLRLARTAGQKLAMLTCYDYTTARLMHEAGIPLLLVGDSAASVILGHDSTIPVSLDFMIELTAAVRRGAPDSWLLADMPFGSYHSSVPAAITGMVRMMQRSGCDAIKLEVSGSGFHHRLIRRAADTGIPVVAHVGLRPQTIRMTGSYRAHGRSVSEAQTIVDAAVSAVSAGAVAVLLEAVPPEIAEKLRAVVEVPVIGCGAGPACDAHVVVLQDLLGVSGHRARFVPDLADLRPALLAAFTDYRTAIATGAYPASAHCYLPAKQPTQTTAK
jgi:3-methyl-2-oxobutanoate hydroxymethyltransferase